jgi:hypothetical protein
MYDYEYEPVDETIEPFADLDDLLVQWGEFLHRELQPFKVVRSDMFGTGCVCDLKTIFLENNFSPDFVMTLIPRVKDCTTECLMAEYSKYMNMFLSAYVNLSGSPMTVADLGQDEAYFYEKFLEIAQEKTVYNVWDLWSTTKRAGN